ncbi:MAG: hypothetical protein ABIJ75_05080 [Actinomycetota bacterium]
MSSKRERQLETLVGFVRNRFPGRKVIGDLYRLAYMEQDHDPDTAERLRVAAERLAEIRVALRGPGRCEIDLEKTARLIRDGDGRPFAGDGS